MFQIKKESAEITVLSFFNYNQDVIPRVDTESPNFSSFVFNRSCIRCGMILPFSLFISSSFYSSFSCWLIFSYPSALYH